MLGCGRVFFVCFERKSEHHRTRWDLKHLLKRHMFSIRCFCCFSLKDDGGWKEDVGSNPQKHMVWDCSVVCSPSAALRSAAGLRRGKLVAQGVKSHGSGEETPQERIPEILPATEGWEALPQMMMPYYIFLWSWWCWTQKAEYFGVCVISRGFRLMFLDTTIILLLDRHVISFSSC